MPAKALKIRIMPGTYGICRLDKDSPIPPWATNSCFVSATRTSEELSVVCEAKDIPHDVQCERPWNILEVVGPLDFSLTGILAGLSTALAREEVSIFAISTYNTDYLLVRQGDLKKALDALEAEQFEVIR